MPIVKYAALLGILLFAAASAQAQVAVRVGVGPVVAGVGTIGPEPVCPYGYYPYYPYTCAPSGYWGPSYFIGGVFVGVGPWYHAHWGSGYWGHGYYGSGYHGTGWGYRPSYGYGRPAYSGPVHGYVGGGYHGSSTGIRGGGGGYHGGGGGFHGGGSHGGGHR